MQENEAVKPRRTLSRVLGPAILAALFFAAAAPSTASAANSVDCTADGKVLTCSGHADGCGFDSVEFAGCSTGHHVGTDCDGWQQVYCMYNDCDPGGNFADVECDLTGQVGSWYGSIVWNGAITYEDNPHDLGGGGPVCGNSVIEAGETCDDGGTDAGDGCSASCQAEAGWTCDGQSPTACAEDPAPPPASPAGTSLTHGIHMGIVQASPFAVLAAFLLGAWGWPLRRRKN